jgi:hypothetical protein
MAKKSKKDPRVEAAFHEVYTKVPKSVKKTGKTGEAKEKMMTAIALSKARQAGADIPSMARGGIVPATGVYQVHRGETIVPAGNPLPGTQLPQIPVMKTKPEPFMGMMGAQ